MTFDRKSAVAAGTRAALGALLLSLSGTGDARAEPVRRLAQRDVSTVRSVAGARPVPLPEDRELLPPQVVREHRKAQRIIDRVCTGC